MSDYERWTIYPLLLLTLGIVLKDKMLKSVDVQSVVCRNLAVVDAQGNEMVRLGATQLHAGGLEVFGANGTPLVTLASDQEGKRGQIITQTDEGHRLVDVFANGNAGQILVHDGKGKIIDGLPGHVMLIPVKQANGNRQPPGGANQGAPPAANKPDEKAPHLPQEKKQQTEEKPAARP